MGSKNRKGKEHMTRNVAILIFDEVEVLDFCGPFEVFGVTGTAVRSTEVSKEKPYSPKEKPFQSYKTAERNDEKPFHVYTVAEKAEPVYARNGLSVNPAYSIENCPTPHILLVPGGYGTRAQMYNTVLLDWISEQATHVELLLSVCTGSLMLGKAGLLDGLSATTHYGAMDILRGVAPNTTICPDERYVDNGKIITSAGISAGIDMSLYVVARLLGEETAAQTARHMQYDYWQGTK
jgi:transcriptional regulator GlxA family with amidase domain